MKKHTIYFRGQKTRIGIDPTRPHHNPKVVAEWEDTIQSDGPPAIWHLTDFAYLKCGIPGAHFQHDPSQPGMFRASRREDSSGHYDSRGKYLAQTSVLILCSRNKPTVDVGTFELPPTTTTSPNEDLP